jgi:hypothetical protein
MVVDLAQMEGQVSAQMHQVLAGGYGTISDDFRIVIDQLSVSQGSESCFDRLTCGVDLCNQLRPSDVSPGKLGVTVSHVPRPAQAGAQEMLQVTGKMQNQRPANVGHAGNSLPQLVVTSIRVDFAADRGKLALKEGEKRASKGACGCCRAGRPSHSVLQLDPLELPLGNPGAQPGEHRFQ